MARGPFVMWADPESVLMRGDFYGPDGKPVVSLRADTTGMMIYLPQDECATWMPMGLRAGEGTLSTRDLIHLLRTGYPIVLEQWQMVDNAVFTSNGFFWVFTAGLSPDTLVLSMDAGDLFPGLCRWEDGSFSIEASSPHDEYSAWPWQWNTQLGQEIVEIELTDINQIPVPDQGIWNLTVPVPIDTLAETPLWKPAQTLMVR